MQSSNSIPDQPHERGNMPVDKDFSPHHGMVPNADQATKMTAHSHLNSTEVPDSSVCKTSDIGNRYSVDLSKKAVSTGKKQQKASDMLKAKKMWENTLLWLTTDK